MSTEQDGGKTIQGHREVLWSGKSGSGGKKKKGKSDGKKSDRLFRFTQS